MASPASAPLAAGPARPIPTVSAPWWTFGHVWMVLAGPAVVVAAGIATVVIAVRTPDPVVEADYYRRGIEINKTLAARTGQGAPAAAGQPSSPAAEAMRGLAPAQAARNHAATPTRDLPGR